MEKDGQREETVDTEDILRTVHYKAMRKLMDMVDFHAHKTSEQCREVADLYPAICNTFPEYQSITQAYVDAFTEEGGEKKLKKAKTLPSLTIIKGNPFKAVVAHVKKSTGKEPILVKLKAAKVVPLIIHLPKWKNGEFLNRASEMLSRTFCVETQGQGRLRRLRQRFSEMNIRKIKAAKVTPEVFELDEARQDQSPITGELSEIASMFCVESKDEARVRRRNKDRNKNKMAILPRKNEVNRHGYSSNSIKNTEKSSDGFDEYFSLNEIEVKENRRRRKTEVEKDKHNGKLSRCLKTVRKMLHKE